MLSERLLEFIFGPAILLIGACVVFWAAPPNTISPFCTYSSQFELQATIKVGDEILKSTVYRQRSMSRKWIETINYAGCLQTYGTVLSFKVRDGRVVLVPTEICQTAERVLLDIGAVDVLGMCGTRLPEKKGFVISTAANPTTWASFDLFKNGQVTLISMLAVATKKWPSDDLDSVAPSLLKTTFDDGGNWWNSPERLIVSGRRKERLFRAIKSSADIGLRTTMQ